MHRNFLGELLMKESIFLCPFDEDSNYNFLDELLMKESIFLCPFDEDSNYNDEFCHNSFLDYSPIHIFFS
jgi:hypothetical protein